MTQEFVHLHCHSEYSLLDGLGRIRDLVQAAQDAKMPALALTDHGTMFGAIEFYDKAREKGLKPIVGCEVYVSDASLDAPPEARGQSHHLVLLAQDEVGYRNLIHLSTEAHLRGFYRKPRVDHALLERHSDGLICLSGCASSEVARLILDGNLPAAEERADWYRQTFPDRYYLELQYHELDFQTTINQGVLHLSQRLGLPLVATNDVHYVHERQASTHEILLCIQTQTTLSDPKRMRLETPQFYLKSAAQMEALFGHIPGAIANTMAIAERCNLSLTFGRPQLPRFATPEGQTSETYLRALCADGVARRYERISEEIRARLDYELSVIEATGFVDYFLLVHDAIHFARSHGIAVGPGRGSAAGSIVAYVLFLTNIDPIAHGLSFERFLNPERVTMPDMDLDFADDRRDEVIQYVAEKYGRERVAQIITFGTLGPRAGVRDVGRCLGMSYGDVDRVAKLVPFMCSSVAKAKQEAPELQQLYDGDPALRRLLDTVEDLEGVARHASTHAAGVVISRDPLTEHVPLYKVPKNDQVTTQYAMSSVEKIGLLKMDFLGLRTLTILERAKALIEQSTGTRLCLDDIPLEDTSIYDLLSTGETFGVFQVDGAGMRRFIRQLRPTEFKHLVALVAMYRPGPMDFIEEFAARKNGEREVTYDHPALEEVLEETYGIVVYQEQVMRLANLIAGYSMGEADLLRRAMAKKKPAELAKHRATFIQRSEQLGVKRETAEHLFDIIEPFSGYAFNKAHSAAYALITAQTAYLKANHPREYMAGLLSAEMENAEKVAEAVGECRRLGITILPPDVNHSSLDFTLEAGGIRFGLSAIKHAGSSPMEAIVAARADGGAFTSLEDFCSRVDWKIVNKRVLESLVKCGALDCLGVERGKLLANLDRIVSFASHMHRAASAGQATLFGEIEEPSVLLQLAIADPATADEKLAWEQELLGTFVSPHPFLHVEEALRALDVLSVREITLDQDGRRLNVGGIIRSVRSFSTKDGKPMGSFQLSDLQSSIEVLLFSRSYERVQSKLAENSAAVVVGKFDAKEGKLRLLADAIHSIEDVKEDPGLIIRDGGGNGRPNGRNGSVPEGTNSTSSAPEGLPPARLSIEIVRGHDRRADIDRIVALYAALQRYPGQDEVELLVRQNSKLVPVPLPNKKIRVCEQLEIELRRIVGDGSWRIEPARVPAS